MNTREYLTNVYMEKKHLSERKINQVAKIIDSYYANNATKLHKIVDKIIHQFGGITDPDHYYSLASTVLLYDMLPNYNWKNNFESFFVLCLKRKIMSEITKQNRDSRMQYERDSTGKKVKDKEGKYIRMPLIYLDAPAYNNEFMETIQQFIVSDTDAFKEVLGEDDITVEKMKQYFQRLSKVQQKIVELLINGYESLEIKNMLRLKDNEYKNHMQAIRASENIHILY